jgi:hypothetical protein
MLALKDRTVNFLSLDSIIHTSLEDDLYLRDGSWKIVSGLNSETEQWLSLAAFTNVFTDTPEFKNADSVWVFEVFERIYNRTGESKRLSDSFQFTIESFFEFQKSTEILEFYLVPQNLTWVFYANRDNWKYAIEC